MSLCGSGAMIYSLVQRYKRRQGRGNARDFHTYHRLLLVMSVFDVSSSVGWLMSPISSPREWSKRYLSVGSVQSCTATGFLIQLAVGVVLYNACLSLYFLCTIRYGVSREKMVWRERIMHVVCISFTITSSIVPVPLDLYNEFAVGSGCWLGLYPQYCDVDPEIDCVRGEGYDPLTFGYILAGVPLMISIITVIVSNVLIYLKARQMVTRVRRHSTFAASPVVTDRQAKRRREIANQATSYVAVFLNSWAWNLTLRQLDGFDIITNENESSWTALILLSQFFSSSAGAGFCITYIRPRYLRLREREYDRYHALIEALFSDGNETRTTGYVSGDVGFSRRSRASSIDDDIGPGPRRWIRSAIGGANPAAMKVRNGAGLETSVSNTRARCSQTESIGIAENPSAAFPDPFASPKEYEVKLKCSDSAVLSPDETSSLHYNVALQDQDSPLTQKGEEPSNCEGGQ